MTAKWRQLTAYPPPLPLQMRALQLKAQSEERLLDEEQEEPPEVVIGPPRTEV
jgi:hypothetical protein